MVNYSFDDLLITCCKEIIQNGFETNQIPDTIKDWLSGKIIRSLPKNLVQQLVTFLIDNRNLNNHVGCRRNPMGDEFTILFYRSDTHKKRKEDKFLKTEIQGQMNGTLYPNSGSQNNLRSYDEDLTMFKGDIELLDNGIDLYAEEIIEEKYGKNMSSIMAAKNVENRRRNLMKRNFGGDNDCYSSLDQKKAKLSGYESENSEEGIDNFQSTDRRSDRNQMMQMFENAANLSENLPVVDELIESRQKEIERKRKERKNAKDVRKKTLKKSMNEQPDADKPAKKLSTNNSKPRKYCPVPDCNQSYTESFRLTNHMNREHLDYLKENPDQYHLFTKGKITENHRKCIQYEEIIWDDMEKIYKCTVCPVKFEHPWKIVRHVENIHLKVKKFSCDICGKSYQTKEKLQHHLMTHSGEKPYSCDYCGKGFIRNDKLKDHKRTLHKEEWREEQRLNLLSKLAEISEPGVDAF